jgi:hypothetical protein
MTTNIDLEHLATKNKIRLDYVIYKDEIKKIPYKIGTSIILNMSSVGHSGTHWTALKMFKDYIFYFDSYGVIPPEEVVDYAKANNKRIIYNDNQLEELDGINCGQLSLFFLSL